MKDSNTTLLTRSLRVSAPPREPLPGPDLQLQQLPAYRRGGRSSHTGMQFLQVGQLQVYPEIACRQGLSSKRAAERSLKLNLDRTTTEPTQISATSNSMDRPFDHVRRTRLRRRKHLTDERGIDIGDQFEMTQARRQDEPQAAVLRLLVVLHGGQQRLGAQSADRRRQAKLIEQALLTAGRIGADAAQQLRQPRSADHAYRDGLAVQEATIATARF